ncbi:MAG: helix-turn-helix transcriptional regulator [Elusimicrobiota bacterium]
MRYLRRSRGLTIGELAEASGVGRNTLSRLERGVTPFNPAVVGRILAQFGPEARKVFAEDPYEHLIPTESFGAWLRNFRMRMGMRQKDLAEALGVHKVTVCRYERHGFMPDVRVLRRLKEKFP